MKQWWLTPTLEFMGGERKWVVDFGTHATNRYKKRAIAPEMVAATIREVSRQILTSPEKQKIFVIDEEFSYGIICAHYEYSDYTFISIVTVILNPFWWLTDNEIREHHTKKYGDEIEIIRKKKIDIPKIEISNPVSAVNIPTIITEKKLKRKYEKKNGQTKEFWACPEALKEGKVRELRIVFINNIAYAEYIDDGTIRFIDGEIFKEKSRIVYLFPAYGEQISQAERQQRLRLERKIQGLCEECGGELDREVENEEAIYYCSTCLKESNEYKARWRQKMFLLGICPQCGERPLKLGIGLCHECNEKNKQVVKASREAAAAEGLCILCKKVDVIKEGHGKKTCNACRDKISERSTELNQERKRKMGICIHNRCRKPAIPGSDFCEKHRPADAITIVVPAIIRTNAVLKNKKMAGKCLHKYCRGQALPGSDYCEKHQQKG